MAVMRCQVTACLNGECQSHGANLARRDGTAFFQGDRIDNLCREVVERTMFLFEARRPPAGEMPVVLGSGAAGILLHEAIGHGMEADFNRKGTSSYASMCNEQVAPDFVTIVDDAGRPNDCGALNVDDEGQPTEQTVLMRTGC